MPRLADAPELVTLAEVLKRLGLGRTAFNQHWRDAFTPRTRTGAPPAAGRPRVYLSDEVAVAVESGREALLTYRMTKKRLARAA